MPLHQTKAIVGKSINLGEEDKITTFYSDSMGKIKGVAKRARGAKNKFGAGLEPFTYVELILFAKENSHLYQINSIHIIKYFSNIFADLDKLMLASYFSELIEINTKEGHPNHELFNLLLDCFFLIEDIKPEKSMEEILRIFELKAISYLGFMPNYNYCIYCHKPLQENEIVIGFNFEKGGIICSKCLQHKNEPCIKISRGALEFAKKFLQWETKKTGVLSISKGAKKEIETLIHNYLQSKLILCTTYQSEKIIKTYLNTQEKTHPR